MSLRELTYGLDGFGCDVEFAIERETDKALYLDDHAGFKFWLPKSCFRDDGEITKFGVKLIKEKYEAQNNQTK